MNERLRKILKDVSVDERFVIVSALMFAKDHESEFLKQFGTFGLEKLDKVLDGGLE